jgi:hypothetical protein
MQPPHARMADSREPTWMAGETSEVHPHERRKQRIREAADFTWPSQRFDHVPGAHGDTGSNYSPE